MKIFQTIVLVCICVLVTLGTVFSGGMFQALSQEGNQTASSAEEVATVQAYMVTHSWIYIIALLLLIAVIVVALKLFRESPDDIS